MVPLGMTVHSFVALYFIFCTSCDVLLLLITVFCGLV